MLLSLSKSCPMGWSVQATTVDAFASFCNLRRVAFGPHKPFGHIRLAAGQQPTNVCCISVSLWESVQYWCSRFGLPAISFGRRTPFPLWHFITRTKFILVITEMTLSEYLSFVCNTAKDPFAKAVISLGSPQPVIKYSSHYLSLRVVLPLLPLDYWELCILGVVCSIELCEDNFPWGWLLPLRLVAMEVWRTHRHNVRVRASLDDWRDCHILFHRGEG